MALGEMYCPGSRFIRQPVPEDVTCFRCGAEVEIWSFEVTTRCPSCGATVYRRQGPTCLDWCAYAKACVGEESYNRIMAERKAAEQQQETSDPPSVAR